MNPPPDDRRYPESDNGWSRQQDRDSWDGTRNPESWDHAQPYPAPAQYHRQDPQSWSEPEQYPGWPRDESYSDGWGYDTGRADSYSAHVQQRETQAYPGAARDRWRPNESPVSGPRNVSKGPYQETRREQPGRQQAGNRSQPRKIASGAPQEVLRFNPLSTSAIVISMLAGLGLVQIADLRALHGANPISSVYVFFIGLIFVFSPAATRILMRKTARAERLTLVILLGIAFYLIKVQASPDGFLLNDEFIHLRNTQNVLSSGQLFQYNPLLPTAAYYPGLATITATLTDLTGLSIFASGLIIIGVARVLISACLYLVAEKVTGSSRGAGTASLLYATNSMFLFWSAQFAYEDLALPLAAFTVWWISRTRGIQGRIAAQALTVVAIVAVTVTHHISAFALCGVLVMLYVAERVLGYRPAERRYTGAFALLTGALAAFWFFVVAKPAADYLIGQNFEPAVQGIVSAISGGGGRQLYGGAGTTEAAPKWYMDVGFAAILIIMAALLPAAIRAWRILRARGFANTVKRRAPIAVAAIVALSFPFTLLPRLTADGSAISGRTSEFIFTAIGCTLGLLMEDVARSARFGTQGAKSLAPVGGLRTLVATFLLTLVFVGQVSIGNSFFNLLPDKSVGFPTYVQPYMISVANWSRQHLGADQTFAADSTNVLALATYGDEDPVNVNVIFPIFFTASMDSAVVNLIKANDVHYVQLDWLATEEAPVKPGGSYYSALEPDSALGGKALPKAYYSKFSTYTCSRIVYHSGTVQIYDVSQIANGSCVPRLIQKGSSKASSGKPSTKLKATS